MGQGAGYGSWTPTRSGSTAKWSSSGYLKDLKVYNDSIYYQVEPRYKTCSTCGVYYGVMTQSGRWNGATYQNFPLSSPISPTYRYGYAQVKVCEDQRFSPDACSGFKTTATVNY